MSFNIAANCDGNESITSMWIEDKRKLCRTLDARSLWKDLASHRELQLSPDDVLILAQQEPLHSPTDGLLHIMANKRATMLDLFHYLKDANLLSAMEIVKKYVPSQWHYYLQPDTIISTEVTTHSNPISLQPQAPPPLIEVDTCADPQRLMLPQDMVHDSLCSEDPLMSSMPELSSTQKRAAHTIMATRHFDIKDIKDATEDFDIKYLISEGQYGSIYRVKLQNTEFAAKVYKRDYKSVLADLQDTRLHSHENIVPITGKCFNGDRVIVLYELMALGSLNDLLDSGGRLNMASRVHILRDAARGLQYLHSNEPPLLHRNVKSKNILLDTYYKAKLSDFGMAVHANKSDNLQRYTHYSTRQDTSVVQRSKGYCAKEVLSGKFSPKTDTYAFGVVILEVCTGLPAYDQSKARICERELVNYIDQHVSSDDEAWQMHDKSCRWARQTYQDLFNLGLKCKSEKAKDRPTMKEIYQSLDEIVYDLPGNTDDPNRVRPEQSLSELDESPTAPQPAMMISEQLVQQGPSSLPGGYSTHSAGYITHPTGYVNHPAGCVASHADPAHMSMPPKLMTQAPVLQTQTSDTNSSISLDFSNISEQSSMPEVGDVQGPPSADVIHRDIREVDTGYVEHTPDASDFSPVYPSTATPTDPRTLFEYLKTEAEKQHDNSSDSEESEEEGAELDPNLLAELEKLNLAVSG